MAEVRNFGCCCDNFEASKVINFVFLVIEGILVISGLIAHFVLRVCIEKYLLVLIQVFHSRLPFQDLHCRELACAFIGGFALIGIIVAIINAIYMIVDALLLVGSIKRNKVALMVGLVLSGIVILGWVVLAVWSVHSNMYAFVIPFTLLTIGLRLWTFLIGVQCYRSIGVDRLQEFMMLETSPSAPTCEY